LGGPFGAKPIVGIVKRIGMPAVWAWVKKALAVLLVLGSPGVHGPTRQFEMFSK
jgi:hypothetical protein